MKLISEVSWIQNYKLESIHSLAPPPKKKKMLVSGDFLFFKISFK
jgi:hypothetical protein